MINNFVGMKPIILVLGFVFVATNAEVYYAPQITDSIRDCDKFKNEYINFDGMQLGSSKGEEGEDAAKLGGEIKTLKEVDDGIEIEIDIWKVLEIGDEYMYNIRADFCGSLGDPNNPWWPILEALNITSCPVPINIFKMDEMVVSLAAVKDVMCHEFCGNYRIEMSMMQVAEKLSCHVLEMSIKECNDE